MKSIGQRRLSHHTGPNMTPLVDVVMVLLVFMMLAGRFGATEHVFASSTLGAGNGPAIDPGLRLDLYITPTSSGFAARFPDGQTCDGSGLRAAFAQRTAAYSGVGTAQGSVLVVLHPSAEPTWDCMAAAHDAAKLAGFERIAFATRR